MGNFFSGMKNWACNEHGLLLAKLRTQEVDERSFREIHRYCASLLAAIGVAARAGEAQLEEEVYDIYLYWQGRASFASDYSLEWVRTGMAPLPEALFTSRTVEELEPVIGDDAVFASLFAGQRQLARIMHEDSPTQLKDFIAPFEERFRNLIQQSTDPQYHSGSPPIGWSLLLPGPLSLLYPTRAFVAEINLTYDALNLLTQRAGSHYAEYPIAA
jgi:hypothetical protein